MPPIFKSKFSIKAILSHPSSDEENQQAGPNIQLQLKQNTDNKEPGQPIPSSEGSNSVEDAEQRPPYTYSALIVMAIRNSQKGLLTLNEICVWIAEKFTFYQKNKNTWQNSIRHNLSINQWFVKVPRPLDDPGRGHYWTLDPSAEVIIIGANTGRIRRGDAIAGNQYPYPYQLHHHHYLPQTPTTPYAMYFHSPGEMMALQEQKMYYHMYQEQQQKQLQQQYQHQLELQHQQQLQQQQQQQQQEMVQGGLHGYTNGTPVKNPCFLNFNISR